MPAQGTGERPVSHLTPGLALWYITIASFIPQEFPLLGAPPPSSPRVKVLCAKFEVLQETSPALTDYHLQTPGNTFTGEARTRVLALDRPEFPACLCLWVMLEKSPDHLSLSFLIHRIESCHGGILRIHEMMSEKHLAWWARVNVTMSTSVQISLLGSQIFHPEFT